MKSRWDFWIDSYFLMCNTGIPFKQGGLIDYDYIDYQIMIAINNAYVEHMEEK